MHLDPISPPHYSLLLSYFHEVSGRPSLMVMFLYMMDFSTFLKFFLLLFLFFTFHADKKVAVLFLFDLTEEESRVSLFGNTSDRGDSSAFNSWFCRGESGLCISNN